jgi:hypothetical protein
MYGTSVILKQFILCSDELFVCTAAACCESELTTLIFIKFIGQIGLYVDPTSSVFRYCRY